MSLWYRHCNSFSSFFTSVTAMLPVGLSEFYPYRASTDSPLICRYLELPSVAILQNQLITVNSKSSSNAREANALMLFFPTGKQITTIFCLHCCRYAAKTTKK